MANNTKQNICTSCGEPFYKEPDPVCSGDSPFFTRESDAKVCCDCKGAVKHTTPDVWQYMQKPSRRLDLT